MKKIPLIKGKFAIVDDEDYKYLIRFHWSISKTGNRDYAIREFYIGKKTFILPMWKLIIASDNNKTVIYKNDNSLDNRKSNLFLVPIYVANHKQAKKRRGVNGLPTSIYKGVCYSKSKLGRKKWVADIVSNGKRFTKNFLTEKEAVLFYNEKARELYGEFAYQNKIKK